MTVGSDRWEEGRSRSEEDQAPLFLLLAMACLLVLMGIFVQGDTAFARATTTTDTTFAGTTQDSDSDSTAGTQTTPVLIHPINDPVRIVIPAIGVDAQVVPVGLLKTGEMQTPDYGYAAWYSLGPAPGEPGPAVMLAHVDSTRGPDVFYRLRELQRYDRIYVYGLDGDYATFEVDWAEQQLKAELPADRIWYYSKQALIRLITCGGRYSTKVNHYLSNVIVYGHLIK